MPIAGSFSGYQQKLVLTNATFSRVSKARIDQFFEADFYTTEVEIEFIDLFHL